MIVKVRRNDKTTYCARIYLFGKRISKTFKRMADAEAWERNQLNLRDKGAVGFEVAEPAPVFMTVRELSQMWLTAKVDTQLSPSTMRSVLD